MSRSFDLDPADRFTAGALGEPGQRTFYVQARSSAEFLTLICEKQQVFLLARELARVLAMLPDDEPQGAVEAYDLSLVEPLDPDWRIGSMSIEFDPERDRIIVLFRELDVEAMQAAAEEALEAALAEGDDEDDVDDEEDDDGDGERFVGEAIARIVLTRAQVRGMAEHALEVVAAGRPRCPACSEPMDVGVEHACIAMNGHRKH